MCVVSYIEEVLVCLRRVIRATDIHSRQLVKTTGLTTPQILLLQAIQNKGQLTISELAGKLSLSQATVTTIVDRLETRKLVYRQRSMDDKRKVYTHLTEKAEEILAASPQPLQEHFSERFSALEDWEQTMIVSALQRVAQMMDAKDLDASPVLDINILERQSNTD